MKTKALLLTSLLSVGFLTACSTQGTEEGKKAGDTPIITAEEKTSDSKSDGNQAPDFSLEGIDGQTYKLSDFKGKKVYLKFWASWCSVCLSTLQDTEELASQDEEKDYVILTVVSPDKMGEKSAEDFKKWYAELGYQHMPVLLDPSGKLLQEYGVRAYPTSAFIDSNGALVDVHPGFIEKASIELRLQGLP